MDTRRVIRTLFTSNQLHFIVNVHSTLVPVATGTETRRGWGECVWQPQSRVGGCPGINHGWGVTSAWPESEAERLDLQFFCMTRVPLPNQSLFAFPVRRVWLGRNEGGGREGRRQGSATVADGEHSI